MATAADILGLNRISKVPGRWSKHHERLSAERDRLLACDRSPTEVSSVKMDDLGDAAAEESQRCLSLVAACAAQANLVDVLEAIRRIERGTYGICEMTGKPIEAERLRAIPWTRYSFAGQNEQEKAGFERKHVLPALESLSQAAPVDGEEAEERDEADKD